MKCKKLSKYIEQIFETPKGSGSWFGYYNYDAISTDGTKMLCNRTHIDTVKIEKGMTIDVGYYDLSSGLWYKIGESDSFNWPQGCMLQWLSGEGNENKVIYNTSKNNHNISCIVDIVTGATRELDWCIYGLITDGKKSITLDMERQHWCRGYHYESVKREELNVPVLEGDGIFEIDLEYNTRKLLIDIDDIISIDKEDYFNIAQHWLEHIMISPNNKRFCFLHRYSVGRVNNYETRLFIADIDGKNLQIIDRWRNMDRTHFGWDCDDNFTTYAYKSNKHFYIKSHANELKAQAENVNMAMISTSKSKDFFLNGVIAHLRSIFPKSLKKEIRIRLHGQQTYYEYFAIENGKFTLKENFILRDFDLDGHPTFTKNGKYMITDSYPDPNQYQRLIVYNKMTKKSIIIARFYAALHAKSGSCDLHPKLCRNNNYVAVDTAYDGSHNMILFKLDWQKIKDVIG